MIDYVSLKTNINIHLRTLKNHLWKDAETDDGNTFYWYSKNGVVIRYYPYTNNFTISGKILMLLYDTQVLNVDDIYMNDTDSFISDINKKLNSLFTRPILDIRMFDVTRIDYCFNVKTEHVTTYINFFNKAFSMINSKTRKNFSQEKQVYGSCYVKTASDYETNSRKNYVLNFYDKSDRLTYQYEDGNRVTEEDFIHAQNVLRLEVQCGYELIQYICKNLKIRKCFGTLFNYNVALFAIDTVYKRIFRGDITLDYFTYTEAKGKLTNEKAKAVLYNLATNHSIVDKKFNYSRSRIKEHGIYPFCLLPKSSTLSTLENPLKLIRKKIASFTDIPELS